MADAKSITVGILIYEGVDQLDVTGPFEVLAHLPSAQVRLVAKTMAPVRDYQGLRLMPDCTLDEAERFDVVHVPGGPGQQALMDDAALLGWLCRATANADHVLSVCTGALLLGAAGLLRGRRATTHWSAFDLLPLFGATAVNERVVVDGRWVHAAGVTAGIDGALMLIDAIAGAAAAQRIQLDLAYDPQPPFDAGTPGQAPDGIRAATIAAGRALYERRKASAEAFAMQHQISPDDAPTNSAEPAATKVAS